MIDVLAGIAIATLLCYLLLNGLYLVFTAIAWHGIAQHRRTYAFSDEEEAFASPLTPPASVLLPAYNEEASIVESVRALLALRYPEHEVLVVNDGSTDATLERLRDEFDLVPVPRAMRESLPSQPVRATYASRRHRELWVIDKENGGKADALNCGVNAARYPYACATDADAVLEEDALLRVAKPILDDPGLVAATGGIVRVANGCVVDHGRVTAVGLPRNYLAALQVVEYHRAFLIGRLGWSRMGALLIISGAFGLFRRTLVEAVGGWSTRTVGEDVELVVRIHRYLRERGERYRIHFVPDPICWTEAPEDVRTLSRQRRRWQRGLAEALWRHRAVFANPRYGVLGTVAFPFFFVLELLGPVIELLGLPVMAIAFALDAVSLEFVGAFLVMSVLLGVLLSLSALALEEFSSRRRVRVDGAARLVVFAFLENLGYRQLSVFWRFQALLEVAFRRRGQWGQMRRRGLAQV